MPIASRSLGARGTGGDVVAQLLLLSTERLPGRTLHPRNCPCPGLPGAVSHLPQPFMPGAARSAVYRGTRVSRETSLDDLTMACRPLDTIATRSLRANGTDRKSTRLNSSH